MKRSVLLLGLMVVVVPAVQAGSTPRTAFADSDETATATPSAIRDRLVTVTNFPNPQNVTGSVNVGNFPVDIDGNLRVVTNAPPRNVLIDTGEMVCHGPDDVHTFGPFEVEDFDTIVTQIMRISDQCGGTALLEPEWRIAPGFDFVSLGQSTSPGPITTNLVITREVRFKTIGCCAGSDTVFRVAFYFRRNH